MRQAERKAADIADPETGKAGAFLQVGFCQPGFPAKTAMRAQVFRVRFHPVSRQPPNQTNTVQARQRLYIFLLLNLLLNLLFL